MARAAHAQGIPLRVLYSVGLTETGRKGRLNPFAMNVDGRSLHFASLDQAMSQYALEKSRGAKLVDIGCMQINVRWHGNRFASVAEMFDPARNVAYAASFLKELRQRYGSWTLAVARYNAGPDNNAAQSNYVCSVIRNLVRSGLGAWTPGARRFCGTEEAAAAPTPKTVVPRAVKPAGAIGPSLYSLR